MIFPIQVVYVCGPISSPTREGRDRNIEDGKRIGLMVWQLGAYPLVPHLNSLGVQDAGVPADAIYLGDLAVLSKCDALYRLPGWDKSFGCGLEVAWAKHRGIPIFDYLDDLHQWLKSKSGHFLHKDKA